MLVRLLGPLAVDDGCSTVEVRGTRQQGLLALLALHPGAVIANERIVDELWGDDAPGNPTNALQATVSRVRKIVGADVLVARGAGYAVDLPPDAVDAVRFERLVSRARGELDAGRPADASDSLREALALWTGPALEELGDLPFARAAAGRLHELRATATDAWADAELALGHHDTLIPDLRAAVERDPLHEGTWARLMLALYRTGRQADALRAYQDARRVLGEELGVEPGPELRSMETSILSQATDLAAPPRARARTTATAPPAELPRGLRSIRSSFVGRAEELDALDRTLRDRSLVTVVGPGGAGKTRLATELAIRRADLGERVLFVDLAPIVSEDDVNEEITAALGGRDQATLTGGSTTGLEEAAVQVATGPVLVVVDNCEHVVDAAARAVEAIIAASERIRVVATSREPLGVAGEQLHPLRTLTPDESAELFTDRARGVRPDFDPTPEDQQVIREICQRLDALPLAIELAAARVRALPVSEIGERLDDRFRLLTAGPRTALPRQQTLRAVVDWSHDLLGEEERHVLARLSAFVGGFTLEDASLVVGGDKVAVEDVEHVVLRLVDKSLVTAGAAHGTARFGLLQTLWHYARDKLTIAGEEGLLRDRHARHFADLVERLEQEFRGPGQRSAMDRIEVEHDNLRAALGLAVESGDKELAARLVAGLGWFWYVRGYVSEGARWAETVASLPDAIPPALEARMLRLAALLHLFADRSGAPEARRAVELARGLDDREELAEVLIVLSILHARDGHDQDAVAALDEAGDLAVSAGNPWLEGTVSMIRSTLLSAAHDLAESVRVAGASAERFRSIGDDWGLSMALMMQAAGLEATGDYEAAMAGYAEAHDAADRLGSDELRQHFLVHRGNLGTLSGDPEGGRRDHEEAVTTARRAGSTQVLAMALNGLGLAARRLHDLEAATAAHTEARDLYAAGGWLAGAALAWAGLGFTAEQAGDAEGAERGHDESLRLARQLGDERAIALACEGLAGAAALRGDHELAARLLGHADGRRSRVGAPLPAGERVDVDRIEVSVIAAIGRERYEALARDGAEAGLDELLPG